MSAGNRAMSLMRGASSSLSEVEVHNLCRLPYITDHLVDQVRVAASACQAVSLVHYLVVAACYRPLADTRASPQAQAASYQPGR